MLQQKHNSSYYIPACKNEWPKGLCNKTGVKCKDCKHRDLLPVNSEIIDKYLRNKPFARGWAFMIAPLNIYTKFLSIQRLLS